MYVLKGHLCHSVRGRRVRFRIKNWQIPTADLPPSLYFSVRHRLPHLYLDSTPSALGNTLYTVSPSIDKYNALTFVIPLDSFGNLDMPDEEIVSVAFGPWREPTWWRVPSDFTCYVYENAQGFSVQMTR